MMAAALVLSCSSDPELIILHVNDTHSHFEPCHDGRNEGMGGIIEMSAYLDSIRLAEGESKILLVHAGDFSQGSSYFQEFGGEMEVDALNVMGFDCVTLGNHEFDNGIEALTERMSRVDCPVVCANLDLSPFELGKYVTPYTKIERGGKKIGIIGLAARLQGNVVATIASRIPQLDAAESVNRYVPELADCDMVILLSHLGYVEDQELVPLVHGVDLVIGGHSHKFVDDFIYVKDADGKEVPIITDGCYGVNVGKISVR